MRNQGWGQAQVRLIVWDWAELTGIPYLAGFTGFLVLLRSASGKWGSLRAEIRFDFKPNTDMGMEWVEIVRRDPLQTIPTMASLNVAVNQ